MLLIVGPVYLYVWVFGKPSRLLGAFLVSFVDLPSMLFIPLINFMIDQVYTKSFIRFRFSLRRLLVQHFRILLTVEKFTYSVRDFLSINWPLEILQILRAHTRSLLFRHYRLGYDVLYWLIGLKFNLVIILTLNGTSVFTCIFSLHHAYLWMSRHLHIGTPGLNYCWKTRRYVVQSIQAISSPIIKSRKSVTLKGCDARNLAFVRNMKVTEKCTTSII